MGREEKRLLAGLSGDAPQLRASEPRKAAPTGSRAAWGESCKDGLVKATFSCSIRDLPSGAAGRGESCKDGLVNGGNHFAFKGIALAGAMLAKRGLDSLS